MFKHRTQLRVRYGETDQMGYLYYGRYAEYFEVGRVEAIRALGLSYKQMEEEYGIFMPVMQFTTRYIRPAFYDDLLSIQTEIRAWPETSISFHSEIFNAEDKLINAATVKLAFVEAAGKTRVAVPPFLQEALAPYFDHAQKAD